MHSILHSQKFSDFESKRMFLVVLLTSTAVDWDRLKNVQRLVTFKYGHLRILFHKQILSSVLNKESVFVAPTCGNFALSY